MDIDDILNMSQEELNELITDHFGKSRKNFLIKYLLWLILIFAGAWFILQLADTSIFTFILIIWAAIVSIGLYFIVKEMIKQNSEEVIIVEIIHDKKRSKLITADTWDKIPKRFLESKGLK